MTFFNNEKREMQGMTKEAASIGPGRYDAHLASQKRSGEASYAPFGALTSKYKNKPEEISLGPGQYNISQPIVKPSIIKYENRNIIIVKVHDEGAHQFKSCIERFKQSPTNSVGPGSYCLEPQQVKKRGRSTSDHHKSELTDRVRLINRQFQESRKPTLLSDPLLRHEKEQHNSTPNPKGVLNWSLNKKERFDLLQKEKTGSQEKRSSSVQFIEPRHKKQNPSAVFASKSIKSHLETKIYKTNNSFKAELRKMINYKDQEPGPGSYNLHNPHRSKNLPKFQFFGSTADRFPIEEEQEVGPGHYQVETKIEKRQRKQNNSFSEQRDSYLSKNGYIPGPGAYVVQTNLIKGSFSEKEISTGFGSQQPRFPLIREDEEEARDDCSFGTHPYFNAKEQRREEDLKLLKRIAEFHPSAVFASNSKRFNSEHSQIEIGCYDTTQNDINARVAKHQKLIKQLEDCQLHKPPFLSSDQRFKPAKPHENEHRNCWCQVKSVQKQIIDHESPAFASNDRRIAVFQQSYKAPPVGYYQQPSNDMIKDSFNSRFRKQTHNKLKKDLVLKQKIAHHNRLRTEPIHNSPHILPPPT